MQLAEEVYRLGVRNMSLTPKTEQWIAFGFSVLVGVYVWIASPLITGHNEPWDSSSIFYGGSLFAGGFIIGLLVPRRFWLWAIGIWLGQSIVFVWYMATSAGGGPLAPLGLFVFLPMSSLLGLLGSCFGAGIGKLFRRFM